MCNWKVYQIGVEFSLIFHSFDTEYQRDIVQIKTCEDVLIKEYYGSNKTTLGNDKLPTEPIPLKVSCFEVEFKSDETYSLDGFNATFSVGMR